MRISYNQNNNQLIGQLSRLNQEQNRLQIQLSSGQRIQSAAEAPATADRVMGISSRKGQLQALSNNLNQARGVAEGALFAMEQLKSVADKAIGSLQRMAEMTDATELAGQASQMDQLLEQAIPLGNTDVDGQYVFGGGHASVPPYTVVRYQAGDVLVDATQPVDPATGLPPAQSGPVTVPDELVGRIAFVRFTGTAQAGQELTYRVGERSELSPFPDVTASQEQAAYFNRMIAARDAGFQEDHAALEGMADSLDDGQEALNLGMLETGTLINGIETLEGINASRFQQLEDTVSKELDIDLAETIVRFRNSQSAYEAALSSSSRIMGLSLLDYLR
ncbi:hypothetical protein H5P28_12290 [Ruficoccus amylovorans]|uniref:Flagellin N-terminal domain-containing protein n=1 Tax=Ruficoccus amylovorans TaxID=1804625 RepID=A0A842HG86_9BACT|nr:hypothetical protein [Ruficoccus amylovorans]MBC2595038.1 hypothetical protein [Ruficoccus amylovorans]